MLTKVKVYPDSDENSIIKKADDSYAVKVKEKAERGEANRAVVKILSDYFHLSANKIRLVKGGKKQNKIFEIEKL